MRSLLPTLLKFFSSRRVSEDARPVSRRQMRQRQQLRGRRIKAILAGGLVFGVGATDTVAAWTDSEEASGSFGAGRFNIELSVDGEWADTSEAKFDVSNMFPGQKTYLPVLVKTTTTTTFDGNLTVTNDGATGDADGIVDHLLYRAVTKSDSDGYPEQFDCGESAFDGEATYVFGAQNASGLRLNTTAAQNDISEVKVAGQAGPTRVYCFEVTLADDTPSAAQGSSASNTWTFDAESVAPEN
ncbi:SipW-dependent-type signal peptide-containing protein [Brevibacterium sp. VCM10]|uniref:SipW-dependent-type signal peptide-containing protein n=1 Tax=Brevibacterium sp. VCM10 TaxID=1381751 RepID=UPI00046EFF41|nr:SipW-dependent-type signal peptide-containing protein [Brevibacterium sp. VCM10]